MGSTSGKDICPEKLNITLNGNHVYQSDLEGKKVRRGNQVHTAKRIPGTSSLKNYAQPPISSMIKSFK